MYLDWIRLENFRTFRDVKIELIHSETSFNAKRFPRPKLPNINLLLGNNGMGKSAFLKGVALAALGPAVGDAGIYPYRLVRRESAKNSRSKATKPPNLRNKADALITARFRPHQQDHVPPGIEEVESLVGIQEKGDLERLAWLHKDEKLWHPVFQSESDAFFVVGYSSTRHVERSDRESPGLRRETSFIRAQRVQGLFQESFPLIPLTAWLPRIQDSNSGRYTQVQHLINKLLAHEHYTFSGEMDGREYVFERRGLKIPFPALSDGYRAYLEWLGDLLYHIVTTCPPGKKLVDNHGIVMVDEIDLHLHPKWQMSVLPIIARELPNLQFIVTSHSPLIVGSLEWVNIIVMESLGGTASIPKRLPAPVHGLDADQVLLTDFFRLDSTRASDKEKRLKTLTVEARKGDLEAAKTLIEEMSRGAEKE